MLASDFGDLDEHADDCEVNMFRCCSQLDVQAAKKLFHVADFYQAKGVITFAANAIAQCLEHRLQDPYADVDTFDELVPYVKAVQAANPENFVWGHHVCQRLLDEYMRRQLRDIMPWVGDGNFLEVCALQGAFESMSKESLLALLCIDTNWDNFRIYLQHRAKAAQVPRESVLY